MDMRAHGSHTLRLLLTSFVLGIVL